jgi:hypothetical protein
MLYFYTLVLIFLFFFSNTDWHISHYRVLVLVPRYFKFLWIYVMNILNSSNIVLLH